MENSLLDRETTWNKFGLDPRIERAIHKLHWEHPTLVQSKAVPLALQGKDILARARTGSGKTGAYVLPILQRLLSEKESAHKPGVKALILVPTRELCEQVIGVLTGLTSYVSNLFSFLQLAADQPIEVQRPRLAEMPDIVVATPGRLVEHLKKGSISLSKTLEMIVIDEADLILSYGYKDDIEKIVQNLPKICQGFLMSATLSPEVENLKRLVLHTPAVLKLEEDTSLASKLQQYVIQCPDKDKFLLIYVMLKLGLIRGKMIVFVNEIDQAFRLKLFLERFSIKSAVLNSELPHNSRYHIVQEFNLGYFDLLIATDEKSKVNQEDGDNDEASEDQEGEEHVNGADEDSDADEDANGADSDENMEAENGDENDEDLDEDQDSDEDQENGDSAEASEDQEGSADDSESGDDFDAALMSDVKAQLSKEEKRALRNKSKHDKLKAKKASAKNESQDPEYGVTRGVDFKSVQIVINFDFPRTAQNYVHRIGRTARAGNAGVALSFVSDKDSALLQQVQVDQEDEGRTIQPYEFKMAIVEGFRYRVEDVLRSVTGAHVKDARIQDIKIEILNSEKLKSHFEDNPRDLESLQHHRPLQASRVLNHLKFVPHYLLPQKKGDAGPKIQAEDTDEIIGYNKNFKQFKRKLNAQSNPLLSLSRGSNKRKYSDAMQDQSYERSNIITDVNPNKKRRHFRKT